MLVCWLITRSSSLKISIDYEEKEFQRHVQQMGANQVAGAIFASTLTTICVFLPIIFTDGITRQIMQDMCLTIAYSLSASLIVALTVVPTMGATLLRKEPNRKHRFFHAVQVAYEKILRFCLKWKAVPILIAVFFTWFSVWKVTQMGIVFMPEMGSEQMSYSYTMPEKHRPSRITHCQMRLPEKCVRSKVLRRLER